MSGIPVGCIKGSKDSKADDIVNRLGSSGDWFDVNFIKEIDALKGKIAHLESVISYLADVSNKTEFETNRTIDFLLDEIKRLDKALENCRKWDCRKIGE